MENKKVRLRAMVSVIGVASTLLNPRLVSIGCAQHVAVTSEARARGAQSITVNIDNVPLTTALYTIARQAGLVPVFEEALIPATTRVTLHLRSITANDAFQHVLRGTGLVAHIRDEGNVVIVRNMGGMVSGIISGQITNRDTKQPLRGARIDLDGNDRAESDERGMYRLTDVSAGAHTLAIKLLGYTKAVRSITVGDNETTSLDVGLVPSATSLSQVVVTGTVIPTELKAVPNAMTVITAKDIEQRGITHIDQLFRGDVPGLFATNFGSGAPLDAVTMYSRGATALGGTSGTTNPIKTYVDGVELADPKYLSQIDPRSIERIEILTGPQASTIYGSNALNGVMQIFTKRSASTTPALTLNLLSGLVQNNFSNARTPQHDYSTQLNGLEGHLAYNTGATWTYIGPWTPAKQTTTLGGFGGARLALTTPAGPLSADVSLRRSTTRNLRRGDNQQPITDYRETGFYNVSSTAGLSQPTTSVLTGQTLGLTLTYTPWQWWSHEFGIGRDDSDVDTRVTARGYTAANDTLLSLSQTHTDRRSLRYTTTVHVPLATVADAAVTVGADSWQSVASSLSDAPLALTGTLSGTPTITRQPDHNAGSFLQTQVSVDDRLFLTYGLRLEWNPNFGADAEPNYAPRYGVAYTQEFGRVTTKLRASYGRSTRPPISGLKNAQRNTDNNLAAVYGTFNAYAENPELTPEYQRGGEGGLEMYFGARSSLIITRYNQTVNSLIARIVTDSTRSLAPNPTIFGLSCATLRSVGLSSYCTSQDAAGYGYTSQYQYLNVASLRNEGWELQGSTTAGPFTAKGTYSWTKSRTIGAAPKYRTLLPPSSYPQYQPGAMFQYLPEHTWSVGLTYATQATTVSLNVNGIGQLNNLLDQLSLQALSTNIRLAQNLQRMTSTGYINVSNAYATADVNASHRFSLSVDGVLQVQNLTNHYASDFWAANATMGRQMKGGVRIHL